MVTQLWCGLRTQTGIRFFEDGGETDQTDSFEIECSSEDLMDFYDLVNRQRRFGLFLQDNKCYLEVEDGTVIWEIFKQVLNPKDSMNPVVLYRPRIPIFHGAPGTCWTEFSQTGMVNFLRNIKRFGLKYSYQRIGFQFCWCVEIPEKHDFMKASNFLLFHKEGEAS